MRNVFFMKFLRFCLKFRIKAHRLIAILLGIGFLMFTQLVVFKPVEHIQMSMPMSAVVNVEKSIVEPVHRHVMETTEDSDIEDIYFGDLIDALEEMTEEEVVFSGLTDLDVVLPSQKPRIAIVIDDVGMNKSQSKVAVALPFPVTVSFLPYATGIQELADIAQKNGLDIMLHVPMQPLDTSVNAGENALEVGMPEVILTQKLDNNLTSLSSYVGINNHMGSAFTQDEKGMNFLMSRLKKEDVFFLDSRTTAESVGKDMAERHGVRFFSRDVFLDHEETNEYTSKALERLEKIALKNGVAIAIGHPKELTLTALKAWAPTLEAKGIELVTLSVLVSR